MAPPQLINLKSEDGIILCVDPEVAKMSLVLRDMANICGRGAEEGVEEPPIPLNITSDVLQMVLQWCQHNYRKKGATSDKEDKEARQLEKRGEILYAITRAANYLDIEGLFDICLNAMAGQIKGKSSLEIRKFFGLSSAGARGEEDLFCLDSVHLRQILSEEVWILVTNKLLQTSPGALESLSNSSPYFRNLLLAKRTAFLFEKVFSLVAPSVWKDEGLEGLPVAEVLQLRTVCSSWNVAIDKLVPEKFQYFGEGPFDNKADRIRDAFGKIFRSSFRRSEREGFLDRGLSISRFLRHFESTHPVNQSKRRNPFIWGNIYVYTDENYQNENEYQNHLTNISKLLSKYGSYIHTLTIFLRTENVSLLPRQLRACLVGVPNLKELRISFEVQRFLERDLVGNYRWKFPKLEHVEKLGVNSLPAPIFNQLIRQTSQISTLTTYQFFEDYKFFTFPLPNLRNLTLEDYKSKQMEKLRSPVVQWPLESLTLRICDDDDVGCADMFQVIQDKFAKTLVNLDLCMTELSVGKDCQNFRLDLPNLKKFTLKCRFIDKEVGLDFLLPMVNNLEEIKVDYNKRSSVEEAEKIVNGATIVQFIGFEEKMLESNIWTFFKKLNHVLVTVWESIFKAYCGINFREEWVEINGDA